ncbi:MAG: YibE/F family protein [Anaerolineae bacterium]
MKEKPALLRPLYNRHNAFAMLIFLICLALLWAQSAFQSPYVQNVERVRGVVRKVDNANIQQYGIVKAGSQLLEVEILEGPYAGQVVPATNDLLGKMETDKMFREGDTALVVIDGDGESVRFATAYDHYRLDIQAILVALFALFLIVFAGSTGARALLSFVFALLMMWKVLFPHILLGRDPVLLALGVVTVMSAVTLLLVAGINRTALVAFLGSFLGVLLTCGLALVLMPRFRMHGAIQPFSETLLYTGFEFLNLNRMFVAAIFIGASGAVVDVAIDVATAMQEVVEKRPDLARMELIRSGFNVGRNMTSTMITTLLMAYVSGYMALLMVFMAQGVPPLNLLNTNYVSAEILKTVVGSFGLVTVAPFTAIMGGLIFVGLKPREELATVTLQANANSPHSLRSFKVEASRCNLRVDDEVTPETVIGWHPETGEPVRAGIHGRVTDVAFRGGEHTLIVLVSPSA